MRIFIILLMLCNLAAANTTINDTDTTLYQKVEFENDPNDVAETATIEPGDKFNTKPHTEKENLLITIVAEDSSTNFFFVKSLKNHPECIIRLTQKKNNKISTKLSPSCQEED